MSRKLVDGETRRLRRAEAREEIGAARSKVVEILAATRQMSETHIEGLRISTDLNNRKDGTPIPRTKNDFIAHLERLERNLELLDMVAKLCPWAPVARTVLEIVKFKDRVEYARKIAGGERGETWGSRFKYGYDVYGTIHLDTVPKIVIHMQNKYARHRVDANVWEMIRACAERIRDAAGIDSIYLNLDGSVTRVLGMRVQ